MFLLPAGDFLGNSKRFIKAIAYKSDPSDRYPPEFFQRKHRHKHGEYLPENFANNDYDQKFFDVNLRNLMTEVMWPREKNPEIHWPVKKEAVVEGDLILGGLMMVHEREDTVTCGPIMPQGGIQALETMLYTLDAINNATLLPSIRLGAHILDDCDKDTYGLEMAVDFIKGKLFLFILKKKIVQK